MRFIDPALVTAFRVRCLTAIPLILLLLSIGSADSSRGPLIAVAAQANDNADGQTADDRNVWMLEGGQPIKRKIAGGEYHYYGIMLITDQYFRLVVDQRGIDVSVKLYRPDGRIVAESNRLTGAYGPESISWVAETSGFYKLEVRSVDREQIAEYYELKLLEERVATIQDKSRIGAQNVFIEAERLREQKKPESLDQAIAKYEEALKIWRDNGDRVGEAETLNVMGLVYQLLKGDPGNARKRYDKALEVWRSLSNRRGEAESLTNIARLYESLRDRHAALDFYNRSLQPWLEVGDRYGEAWTLFNLGRVHNLLKDAPKALDHNNRALNLWRDLGDLSREAATLNGIGEAYVLLNDYKNAISTYEQARQRWQAAGDLNGEVSTLFSISRTYAVLQDKRKESEFKSLAEELRRRIERDRSKSPEVQAKLDQKRRGEKTLDEARALLLQGTEDSRRRAIAKNQEAVQIFESIGDYERQVSTLFDISSTYRLLGEKENERKTLERSLAIGQRIRKPALQAEALQRLAGFHSVFGDRVKAVDHYDRALELWRRQGDRNSEAYLLAIAAKAYNNLDDREKAVNYLERARILYQSIGDRLREAYTLNDLAALHDKPEEKQTALGYLKRARDLRREKGDRAGEAETLKEIIAVYLSMGEKREALEYYHQALAMYREIRDGMGEAEILRDLMGYWKELNQLGLAIFHGKQAINTYQEVRRNIQGLEKETQTSFIKSKEDIYRELADLLISRGRLPEAQQVLELLKEEEFINFIRGKRKKDPSLTDRAELTPRENELYRKYTELTENATSISNEYQQLLAKEGRSADDNKRMNELFAKLQVANERFQNLLNELSKALLDSDDIKNRIDTIKGYQGLMDALDKLGPGSVALYTLLVKDKYRVILFTPRVKVARQYSIKVADLNKKIMVLRSALQEEEGNPLPIAKELYQILIGPIAKDLEGADAKTLMWSLDGALRYIPIAVLHDGEKYMVERYRNEVFTLTSVSRLSESPVPGWRGLGLGASKFSAGLDPLPAVIDELKGIIRNEDDPKATGGTLPGKIMIDNDFTKDAMIAALQLQRYNLVHIASHFKLRPEGSYLVLGKGDELTVAQLRSMPNIFSRVELLTLSACNTGVGLGGGNGEEVEVFGEVAQEQGARAVIASLWSVADQSTGLLMQKFYQFRMRSSQPTTKADALREVQLAFLRKEVKSPEPDKDWSNPYYWAPFILIGNWK